MFQKTNYESELKNLFQSMCEIDITDNISREPKGIYMQMRTK